MKKRNRGITLIALVITIIVLLILAAVSIATLTGDNGILTKANTAKTTNEVAQAEEEMKLLLADWQLEKRANSNADLGDFLNEKLENGELDKVTDNGNGSYTIEKNGYETTISDEDGLGEIAKVEPPKETIFKNVDTTETYPDGSMPTGAKIVEENGQKLDDADEGIVIKDTNDNEWVWIEVPKSEMPKGLKFENEEDYNTLTAKLKEYAYPYTKGAAVENYNWKDEWYDKLGTTYNGIDYYSEVRYIDSETSFNEAKTYYTNIYTDKGTTIATSYESGATYYTKITENLDDTLGCGLTYNDYQETYQKMLRSVYTNGGFWIGRYEAGIEGTTESAEENPKILELGRTKVSARIDEFSPKSISKKDAVPYSFVY